MFQSKFMSAWWIPSEISLISFRSWIFTGLDSLICVRPVRNVPNMLQIIFHKLQHKRSHSHENRFNCSTRDRILMKTGLIARSSWQAIKRAANVLLVDKIRLQNAQQIFVSNFSFQVNRYVGTVYSSNTKWIFNCCQNFSYLKWYIIVWNISEMYLFLCILQLRSLSRDQRVMWPWR